MVLKKNWLYAHVAAAANLINFGTALFILFNGIWIMNTHRRWSCVCSHDCWCRILPLYWTPPRYEFWVQGSSFPKRCWNCQDMHLFSYLLWTPAQSEHDTIVFVGPYSGLAMQFSVEATLLAELSGGFLGAYKKCLLCSSSAANLCAYCWTTTVPFVIATEPVFINFSDKVNHESWWVTVEMVMMSVSCDGAGISRPPSKLQPSFVTPESVWFTCLLLN